MNSRKISKQVQRFGDLRTRHRTPRGLQDRPHSGTLADHFRG